MNATPSSPPRWANLNTLLGIVCLIAALVFLFYLVPQHIEQAPRLQNPLQSPRWLPTVAGWIILLLSIALVIEGCLRPPQPEEGKGETGQDRAPAWRWLLLLVALASYWLLFEALGAIVAGVLATVLLFLATPVRKPWLYGLAVLLPWLVCLLFIHVLNVPLPSGSLWE
ncbi:tripartite tricarboxylate transporter TctB family protein [Stutzerimonas azotifigens]|uniref:Tripartite tricarboxylate transporter TctB family protein n=1 Tax=Stutzerimonas azotifigens TaxID=291995 RepID=A0ABR5YZC8_9GAMM|nr:tripartite tricarboxylate transporter TctB family protein [Stutzerimonas azotifigens]MBA1273276.1 tripartite tricarboxylate transporter TctB family protein [Stutzerimonas azotifigens]